MTLEIVLVEIIYSCLVYGMSLSSLLRLAKFILTLNQQSERFKYIFSLHLKHKKKNWCAEISAYHKIRFGNTWFWQTQGTLYWLMWSLNGPRFSTKVVCRQFCGNTILNRILSRRWTAIINHTEIEISKFMACIIVAVVHESPSSIMLYIVFS